MINGAFLSLCRLCRLYRTWSGGGPTGVFQQLERVPENTLISPLYLAALIYSGRGGAHSLIGRRRMTHSEITFA